MADVAYEFVGDVNPNLICAICQNPFIDPVTTSSCKHTFCETCIHESLKHKTTCPIDRSQIDPSTLHDAGPVVLNMLEELEVKCLGDECGYVTQRGLMISHTNVCAKAIVKCLNKACAKKMTREELPNHRAYVCEERKMKCGTCSMLVPHSSHLAPTRPCCPGHLQDSTHRWSCSEAEIPCDHAEMGCSALVKRNRLQDHLAECLFEQISPMLNKMRAEIAELQQERVLARQHINDLLSRQTDRPRIATASTDRETSAAIIQRTYAALMAEDNRRSAQNVAAEQRERERVLDGRSRQGAFSAARERVRESLMVPYYTAPEDRGRSLPTPAPPTSPEVASQSSDPSSSPAPTASRDGVTHAVELIEPRQARTDPAAESTISGITEALRPSWLGGIARPEPEPSINEASSTLAGPTRPEQRPGRRYSIPMSHLEILPTSGSTALSDSADSLNDNLFTANDPSHSVGDSLDRSISSSLTPGDSISNFRAQNRVNRMTERPSMLEPDESSSAPAIREDGIGASAWSSVPPRHHSNHSVIDLTGDDDNSSVELPRELGITHYRAHDADPIFDVAAHLGDLLLVVDGLVERADRMERVQEAQALSGDLRLQEEVAELRSMVNVMRPHVMGGGQSLPPTPRIPSFYSSISSHDTVTEPSPATEDPEHVSNILETIAFSTRSHVQDETSSVSSLITANNPIRRNRWGNGTGRPMGIPPELGDGTPTVRVVVHRPVEHILPRTEGSLRPRSSMMNRLMHRAPRSSRGSASPG